MPKELARRCLLGAVLFMVPAAAKGAEVIISVSNPSGLQGSSFGFGTNEANYFNTNDHSMGWLVYDQDTGNLIAFHVRDNGNYLVTTNNGLMSGGMDFADGEVVEVNPGTMAASSFVNFENILDQSVDIQIDAIAELNDGRIAFSTGNEGLVSVGPNAGLPYARSDVLVYDPTDMSIGKLLDSALITGGDRFNNLNGVTVLDDGRIAFTVSTGGTPDIFIAGLTFQRNDAVLYDPATQTATILIEGANTFEGPPSPSINALHVIAVPEPSSLALMMLTVAALCMLQRRSG